MQYQWPQQSVPLRSIVITVTSRILFLYYLFSTDLKNRYFIPGQYNIIIESLHRLDDIKKLSDDGIHCGANSIYFTVEQQF